MRARSERLEVRLSSKERALVQARARKDGRSVSDYVRYRVLSDDTRPIISVDSGLLREILTELKRHGTNLNQLAKYANQGRLGTSDLPALTSALKRDSDAAQAISNLLASLRS